MTGRIKSSLYINGYPDFFTEDWSLQTPKIRELQARPYYTSMKNSPSTRMGSYEDGIRWRERETPKDRFTRSEVCQASFKFLILGITLTLVVFILTMRPVKITCSYVEATSLKAPETTEIYQVTQPSSTGSGETWEKVTTLALAALDDQTVQGIQGSGFPDTLESDVTIAAPHMEVTTDQIISLPGETIGGEMEDLHQKLEVWERDLELTEKTPGRCPREDD